MKKGLIIYDFDGVIVDSKIAVFLYYRALFGHFGLEMPDCEDTKVKQDLFAMTHIQMLEKYAGVNSDHRHFTEMINYVPDISEEIIQKTTLLAGVDEVVPELSSEYHLAICTNRGSSVDGYLKHYKLKEYFSYVITSRDVSEGKPSPEGVFKILNHFNTSDALFVGDSFTDYYAAKGANVKFISFESELKESPIITHHRDIYKYL